MMTPLLELKDKERNLYCADCSKSKDDAIISDPCRVFVVFPLVSGKFAKPSSPWQKECTPVREPKLLFEFISQIPPCGWAWPTALEKDVKSYKNAQPTWFDPIKHITPPRAGLGLGV